MREIPYISILAPGHKTSKGFFPAYHFDFEKREFYLSIGYSFEYKPPLELIERISEKLQENLSDFPALHDQILRTITYQLDSTTETELVSDLNRFIVAYADVIEFFHDDLNVSIKDHKISFKTINLNQDWRSIHKDLLNILN